MTKVAKDTIGKLICAKIPFLCSGSAIDTITSVPVFDNSVKGAVTSDTNNTNAKELWGDTIARCGAREILNKISGDIVNTARTSGRDGGTTYVRNWRNFLTRAEYRGEDMFRAMLSNTNICNYMAQDAKSAFGVTRKINLPGVNTRSGDLNSYALRANCTMPKDFDISEGDTVNNAEIQISSGIKLKGFKVDKTPRTTRFALFPKTSPIS